MLIRACRIRLLFLVRFESLFGQSETLSRIAHVRTARESNEFNINKYFIRLTSIGMHRSLVTRLVDTKMLVLFWFFGPKGNFSAQKSKRKGKHH